MNMAYTTIQGDTWDLIAFKVYGAETYADFLMSKNFPLLDLLVFPSGIIVETPDLPEELASSLPAWRR